MKIVNDFVTKVKKLESQKGGQKKMEKKITQKKKLTQEEKRTKWREYYHDNPEKYKGYREKSRAKKKGAKK